MSELITRTARLVPYAKRPKQVPSFVTAHAYEPASDDPAAALGSLFIVGEVLLSGRPSEDLMDLIIGSFSTSYYGHDETMASLAAFETAVKAVNTALAEHVNAGNAAWIGKLSAVIAVQCNDELHLSHTGSAEAFLYRGKAATQITAPAGARPTGPSKTFGSIASGQLEAADRLLLATPALIHQLSLPKIHDVITSNSPNAAIGELTELLRGTDIVRIACLVVEATTPEQAALQVRTEHPDEIMLGAPETAMEAAKLAAAPLAAATLTTSRKASKAARIGVSRAKPHLRRVGLTTAAAARAVFSGERVAKLALAGIAVAALIIGGLIWQASRSHDSEKLTARFNADYHAYLAATSSGSKDSQLARLASVTADVKSLLADKAHVDRVLAHTKLSAGQPRTIEALSSLISSAEDRLAGVQKVTPTPLVNVASADTNFTEFSKGNIYLISKKSSIYVVNISTKSLKKALVDTSKVGTVVATSLSSTGDGIYLLTSEPNVWFYRFSTNSVTPLSLGLSSWEPATSIAAYGGNLYLAASGQINKHVPTSTGFSPAEPYLVTPATNTSGASAIMVNGYVYLATTNGLHQYLSGASKATIASMPGLSHLTTLRGAGDDIIGVNPDTARIGLWNDATGLVFEKQFELSEVPHVLDAILDGTTGTIYALTPTSIVSFNVGR